MKRLSFRMFLALSLAGLLLPAVASAAPAPTLITAGSPPLVVEVGKGVLVRLERPANSVFVADPDVADVQVKSSTLVYLFGKSGGETTLFAVGDRDQVALNATIRVRYDTMRIQEAIHELAPRSAVSVSTIGDALVIDGTVYDTAEGDDIRRVAGRYLQDPKQLINRMKVDAPNQVNLRVRIAEISRDLIKQMGFNWDATSQSGSFLFGLAAGPNITNAGGTFLTRELSTDLKTTVNNLFGSAKIGNADLNVLIDALDSEGLITVLAEPNLTAVSGESASFLAGGEFPIASSRPSAPRTASACMWSPRSASCPTTAPSTSAAFSCRRSPRGTRIRPWSWPAAKASRSPACCRTTSRKACRNIRGSVTCRSSANSSAPSRSAATKRSSSSSSRPTWFAPSRPPTACRRPPTATSPRPTVTWCLPVRSTSRRR